MDEILAFGESVSVIGRAGRVDLAKAVDSARSTRNTTKKKRDRQYPIGTASPISPKLDPIKPSLILLYPLLDLLSDLANLLLGPDDDSVQVPLDLLGGGDSVEDAIVQLPILVLDVDE